jgi:hypothetical protein
MAGTGHFPELSSTNPDKDHGNCCQRCPANLLPRHEPQYNPQIGSRRQAHGSRFPSAPVGRAARGASACRRPASKSSPATASRSSAAPLAAHTGGGSPPASFIGMAESFPFCRGVPLWPRPRGEEWSGTAENRSRYRSSKKVFPELVLFLQQIPMEQESKPRNRVMASISSTDGGYRLQSFQEKCVPLGGNYRNPTVW